MRRSQRGSELVRQTQKVCAYILLCAVSGVAWLSEHRSTTEWPARWESNRDARFAFLRRSFRQTGKQLECANRLSLCRSGRRVAAQRCMCGIIGYIGSKDVVPVLIDGLRRLEYRGYDSAGIAVVADGNVALRRSAGKLSQLEAVLDASPIAGQYGVGHTRWATHGRPTDENANPHRDCTGRGLVVHNGITENYLTLK